MPVSDANREAFTLDRHRATCGICTSDHAADIGQMFLSGHKPRQVRAQCGEFNIRVGVAAFNFHRANAVALTEPPKSPEPPDMEAPELTDKFLRQLTGVTMPTILNVIYERLRAPGKEGITFSHLINLLELSTKMTQLLMGQPTSREERIDKRTGVTMKEMAETIDDPVEKEAFLQQQRDISDALRAMNSTAKKHINSMNNGGQN